MNSDFDLYEVLEVNIQSHPEEIKKSYKKLALKHHPDRPEGNKEKFQRIAIAYEILSDPQKKYEYDRLKKTTRSFGASNSNSRSHQSDPDLNEFYQKHSTSFFNPFSIFQDIFGEFINFMVSDNFSIQDMEFENRSILDDIDALEELYMANMNFGMGLMSGSTLQFGTNIQVRNLAPIFEKAHSTVQFLHDNFGQSQAAPCANTYLQRDSVPPSSACSAWSTGYENQQSIDPNFNIQSQQVKIPEKNLAPKAKMEKQEPKDLIQTIKVNLLDIYQNKTKRFNLTRIRKNHSNPNTTTREKIIIEIPLVHKQIKIPGKGDWLPNWEKPGDVIINVISKRGKFLRINDWDMLTYHQITLVEWYQGYTVLDFIDGSKLKLQLPITKRKELVESNLLIKIPNKGLPKDNKVKMRGSLYVQLVLLPPNPGDMEAEDVPQFIRILGSSKEFLSKTELENTYSVTVEENVEVDVNSIFDFINYDDEK